MRVRAPPSDWAPSRPANGDLAKRNRRALSSWTMVDARAPGAIRVSRPYASNDELIEHEADAFSRAGIVLLGAQARPEGSVLRFELTLQDGTSVLRGEGRVTGMKTVAGEQGLALRFTRLDSKSKALIDRAAAFREARANKPVSSAELPPNPVASDPSLEDTGQRAAMAPPPEPAPTPLPRAPTPVLTAPSPAAAAVSPAASVSMSGDDRAHALDRLRARSTAMSPEAIAKLLASRPR